MFSRNIIMSARYTKQAGTGPSRRHIRGSKIVKRLPSVKYSLLQYSKSKIFRKKISKKITYSKNGPSGAPGPTSAIPWRAKRRIRPKLSTFLSQLKGGPFGEKTNFRKKISQSRKTERGDSLGFSNIHSDAKQQKIVGGPFGGNSFSEKKVSQCRKK